MNILQWLKKQGYDYTWNVKLGAKTPDIIAFKDKEIIAFEIKKHALEVSDAVGQCLFYLQKSNKSCIILPKKEIKKEEPKVLPGYKQNRDPDLDIYNP